MCTRSIDFEAMADEDEAPTSAGEKQLFGKHFHVPRNWLLDENFLDLCNHSYATKDHKSAFKFIEKRLRILGYSEDNQRMLHDYMHFLLMDLLTAAAVPFLSEEDMKEDTLSNLFDKKTPDLIVKSAGPNTSRPKPLIIDVFVGKSEKAMSDKKAKYSTMKVTFDFTALTVSNYNTELLKVLNQTDVAYFHHQFVLFQAEYSYWHACLKFKKILFNDVENSTIRLTFDVSDEFVVSTVEFKNKLQIKAAQLADNDDL